MSGITVILALDLFVAGLLSAVFLMIAVYDRSRAAARWLAFSYAIGMGGVVLIQAVIPQVSDARPALVASAICMIVGLAGLNVGLARHYHVAVPWRLLGVVLAVTIMAEFAIKNLPSVSIVRLTIYQMPFAILQLVALSILAQVRGRLLLDNLLFWLFGISALHFIVKPVLAVAIGGAGDHKQAFLSMDYRLLSETTSTVVALTIALLMMAILVRDLLFDATRRSGTDALSGLLNRRGFEERAERAVRAAVGGALPLALVIADLDRFKLVNDTHGHAAGDAVVAGFARLLQATGGQAVVGRIGGEEFAVILPGCDIVSARLFAEGVRNAFATQPVEGLAVELRFTASFGVAQWTAADTVSTLLRRADGALYEAKRDGRDRVCVATNLCLLEPAAQAS